MGAGVGGVTYTIRTGHALHTAAQCSGGLCCLPLESGIIVPASGVTTSVFAYSQRVGNALPCTDTVCEDTHTPIRIPEHVQPLQRFLTVTQDSGASPVTRGPGYLYLERLAG